MHVSLEEMVLKVIAKIVFISPQTSIFLITLYLSEFLMNSMILSENERYYENIQRYLESGWEAFPLAVMLPRLFPWLAGKYLPHKLRWKGQYCTTDNTIIKKEIMFLADTRTFLGVSQWFDCCCGCCF